MDGNNSTDSTADDSTSPLITNNPPKTEDTKHSTRAESHDEAEPLLQQQPSQEPRPLTPPAPPAADTTTTPDTIKDTTPFWPRLWRRVRRSCCCHSDAPERTPLTSYEQI